MTVVDPREADPGEGTVLADFEAMTRTRMVVPDFEGEQGVRLTAANHSEGVGATIEALHPLETFEPEVEYAWTQPKNLSSPGLPPALRRVHLRPPDPAQLLPVGGVVRLRAADRYRTDRCLLPPGPAAPRPIGTHQ
jgi:hypothetical protein